MTGWLPGNRISKRRAAFLFPSLAGVDNGEPAEGMRREYATGQDPALFQTGKM
jgi:hypothetical protein